MKAQYRPLIETIEHYAPLWQRRLLLDHYEIEHVYLDSFFGDDGEEDFKVTATTEVRWNYLEAKIKWYLPSAVRHSIEHIEQVVVHELCHVMLAPEQQDLPAKYSERLELATEMTARAVFALGGAA